MSKLFKDIDYVFNLAGFISFKKRDKQQLNKINYEGTINVLKECEKHQIKKLIHISSTAALGFGKQIIDEKQNFNWTPYKNCVYSYSKKLPEKELLESSCNTIIIYPPLILGPGEKENSTKLFGLIKDKKLLFNTPGKGSFIDVRDLADGLIFLMEKEIINEKFIINSENYTFKEYNARIAEVFNVKAPKYDLPKFLLPFLLIIIKIVERLNKNPAITYENIFMAFQNRTYSSQKIINLGFKPKYTLKDTIKDTKEILIQKGKLFNKK